MSLWPHNAPANLRASQIECERSELPKIARQVQRTLCGNVENIARACVNQRSEERGNEREEVGHSSGTRLEHEKRESTLRNVLLILKPPVDGHEDLKASLAGGAQQDTILHARPSEGLHRGGVEARQVEKQVVRDGLVEEDTRGVHTATSASSASRARPSDAWACSRVTLGN